MSTTTIQNSDHPVPQAGTPAREAQSGCCGGAPPEGVLACCAKDAEIRSGGGSGCGCAPKAAPAETAKKGCCSGLAAPAAEGCCTPSRPSCC